MTQDAVGFIQAQLALARQFALLQLLKGVVETSAIALLGELLLLPPGLSHKQWVKAEGLDPREFTSGSSLHERTQLSKAGNWYVRQALYVLRAVMRKLLHTMHGMLTRDNPFDNTRLYALPN